MTKEQAQALIKSKNYVWFMDRYNNLCRGVIKELNTAKDVKTKEDIDYAIVDLKPDHEVAFAIGTQGAKLDTLYTSKKALLTAEHEKSRKRIEEIKDSIKIKDDLIRFMFDHTVACCGEYTDWDARTAIRELCFERYGIKLD